MLTRFFTLIAALCLVPAATAAQNNPQGAQISQALYQQSMTCMGHFRGSAELLVVLLEQRPDDPALQEAREASRDLWETLNVMEQLIYAEERGLNIEAGLAVHERARAAFANRENLPYQKNLTFYQTYGPLNETCLDILVTLQNKLTR